MKVHDLVEKLGLKVFSGHKGLDKEITGGYVSDLLSDVMGNAKEGTLWLTLQTHRNIMAVASLKDLSAIVLVKGLEPEALTIAHSNKEDIPILGSPKESFEICGEIYQLLNS